MTKPGEGLERPKVVSIWKFAFSDTAAVMEATEATAYMDAQAAEIEKLKEELGQANRDKAFAGEIMGTICAYGTLVRGERPVDPPPHAAVDAILTQINRAESAEAANASLVERVGKLEVAARVVLEHGSRCDDTCTPETCPLARIRELLAPPQQRRRRQRTGRKR